VSGRLKLALALLAASIAVLFAAFRPEASPRLVFLSVGQGDCTVWMDGETTTLIDVGPLSRDGFDSGERIVLPKLRGLGVRSVDLIVITHPDSDHIGGLKSVRKRYPSARIVASEAFRANPDMVWWLRRSGIEPDSVVWVKGRTQIDTGASQIELAAPKLLVGASDNEGSLFVRIKHQGSQAVLTGDASTSTEESMQKELKWAGEILKAGHHGSRTSTSESFVRSVSPTWAVVSCGRENMFGHPHKSVLQVLGRQGVAVLRTDVSGDLTFLPTPSGFEFKD
jgi:competence protein ComEC